MATTTTNLALIKPAGSDKIRIDQINGNMDVLDAKIGAVGNTSLQEQINEKLDISALAMKYLGANPTGGAANDTTTFWTQIGSGYAFISSQNQINDQPSTWGLLINYVVNSEIYQVYHVQPNHECYFRGANGGMTQMPNWKVSLSSVSTQNAGYHNSIFRGKNLGTSVTSAQWDAISSGMFDDLFIGDYWPINGIVWRIAAFDYWYNCGDAACITHHAVIVPDANLVAADGTSPLMNAADTTEGAYVGSDFYTGNNGDTGKSQCITKINSAFGAGHILTHREYLQNAVTNGYGSAGAYYDSTLECMNEQMVYGGRVFGDIMHGSNIPVSYTISKSQLPLFALAPSFISNRAAWWLRDVASALYFAYVGFYGDCSYYGAASAMIGLRPVFAICAE